MISQLRGQLVSTEPRCVVRVGGVGFEVQVPEKDRLLLARAAGEVSFYTYLYVREDRLSLYGFLRPEDRELFTRLIDVSGVGPKLAVNMMAEHSTEQIARAIRSRDHAFLCRLPGIGRRTAERLSLELKDKLGDIETGAAGPPTGETATVREEAVLALTSLGLTRAAAEKALDGVDWASQNENDVAEIVKQALRQASSI